MKKPMRVPENFMGVLSQLALLSSTNLPPRNRNRMSEGQEEDQADIEEERARSSPVNGGAAVKALWRLDPSQRKKAQQRRR
jgi:hypothetical protein